MDWFHGTDHRFKDWQVPPPPLADTKRVFSHTAVFLTADRQYARGAGRHLCRCQIRPSARILDIRVPTAESEQLRNNVHQAILGQAHISTATPMQWVADCRNGAVMRFMHDERGFQIDPDLKLRLRNMYAGLDQWGKGERSAPAIAAWVEAQRLTREWIDLLGIEAKKLGYDVMLAREIDRHTKSSPVARDIAFVFHASAVTPPKWSAVESARVR